MKKLLSLSSGLWLVLCWLAPTGWAQSIKPGTEIHVRLVEQLATDKTRVGRVFSATVAESVRSGNRTIISRGTSVKGEVVDVVSSGLVNQPASIKLQLTEVGSSVIQTETTQIDGKSRGVRNLVLIGGGANVGRGASTAAVYVTAKHEIVLPAETLLTFVMADRRVTGPESPRSTTDSRAISWQVDADQAAYDNVLFSEYDQSVIRAYFRRGTKSRRLPPSLEKQLRCDGTLSPGLQKRVEPFPVELERQLPRLPRSYSRVIVSDRALVLTSSNKIIDVMFIHE